MFMLTLEALGARDDSSLDNGFGNVMSALADARGYPRDCGLYRPRGPSGVTAASPVIFEGYWWAVLGSNQ